MLKRFVCLLTADIWTNIKDEYTCQSCSGVSKPLYYIFVADQDHDISFQDDQQIPSWGSLHL